MDTPTNYRPYSSTELETIHAIEADQDWHNDAQSRIAHADALLQRIGDHIDTVPAHRRAHAADMLDSVIDLLERTSRRFAPLGPEAPAHDPPF